MILQHPIHYDDFDDEVLGNLTGHGCVRGNWTIVNGNANEALLRESQLYLTPASTTDLALRTDALVSNDQRIEALGVVRGDYPYMDVYLRWDAIWGASLEYLLTRFDPSGNTVTHYCFAGGAAIATLPDTGMTWAVGDEIFFEIIAIAREVTFRTTNLTNHYTTHADYRIPAIYTAWADYAGLGLTPAPQETNHDNAFDYFKVFPAGEQTP